MNTLLVFGNKSVLIYDIIYVVSKQGAEVWVSHLSHVNTVVSDDTVGISTKTVGG